MKQTFLFAGRVPPEVNMRRVTAIVLSVAMSLFSTTPLLAAPAPQAPATASISGTATDSSGQALAKTTVQLRNVQSAQLAGTTTSTTTGQFGFAGLNPGTFSVEVVHQGAIIGTSAPISVAAGQVVTGVSVASSAALAAAAGMGTVGVAGGGLAGAAGSGAFLASTAGILTVAAIGAGVVGTVVAVNKSSASPSQ